MGVMHGMVPNTILTLGTDRHMDILQKFSKLEVRMKIKKIIPKYYDPVRNFDERRFST